MRQELSVVGKRLPRPDGAEKVTGRAQYAADIKLPGMLIGRVLRSPHPHARVLKVDTSKAEKLPGVEAVITFKDIPGNKFSISHLGILRDQAVAPERRENYVLCDQARHVGEAVAAVAAVNESVAEEALELIEVEYEPLPAVFDPMEAMKPDAPQIHDFAKGNIADHIVFPFSVGSVEKGLKEAAHVIQETFRTTRQKHCPMELSASIASFDDSGRLTVWSPTQQAHPTRTQLARLFDLPEGMVRVLSANIGGGFGARQSFVNEPICVCLAKKAGKPVKLVDTREEDLMVRETRESFVIAGTIGVKGDGTIAALRIKATANAGAYFSHSGATTNACLRHFSELYRCHNVDGEADIVYTNTTVSGGMRGYGNPPATFAREQLIDMAAERLGIDPLEFRLKNVKGTGEPGLFPFIPIENSALEECARLGAKRIGWQEKRGKGRRGRIRHGIGVAFNSHGTGAAPGLMEHSSAFVKLNPDGSADVMTHPCEMGQGILGVLAQIAAEELGLSIANIHMVTADTDVTPFDCGSHASRSAYAAGNAVRGAALEARLQLLERAGKALGTPTEELDVKDGRIYIKTTPTKGISIAEVARNAIYNYRGDCVNILGRCSFVAPHTPSFQATFAKVEVDVKTGQIKVLKVVSAVDCGRAINPMTVEGQVEGAIAQGIGYALFEDFVIDPDTGVPITENFDSYRIPKTLDVPEIEVILAGQPVASGPFGAKGVGEIGTIGVAPAIANAIYDAVGVRVTDLPITAEAVLKELPES